MAYTTEDLQRIEEAIQKLQTGQRVVQVAHDGHVVKYAEVQLSELVALRDKIKSQVVVPGKQKVRRVQIIANKGVR